jgi:hypothetical protein
MPSGIIPVDPTLLTQPIVLVEMTVYDPSIPGTRVLYYADRSFRTGAGDTPASTLYRNRIVNPGTLSINLIEAWAKGIAAFGIGEVQLVNTDKALDVLATYTFDGWPVSIYLATLAADQTLTKTLVFTGYQENPDCGWRIISVPIRTQMYNLDRPVVTESFAGTGGIEGDSTVTGLKKPTIFGRVRNVPLILVDAANLIYYVGKGPVPGDVTTMPQLPTTTPDMVRDAGVELTYNGGAGVLSNFATLQAFIVPAGRWEQRLISEDGGVTYKGLCVKLGSTPVGQVTASIVDQFVPGNDLTTLVQRILNAAGQTLEYLDVSYPITVPHTYFGTVEGKYGRYIDDESTYAEVLGALAQSVAGWLWYDSTVNFHGGWILQNLPDWDTSGVALAVVPESHIIDMKKLGNPKTPGEGIPPWSINYKYDRNELVQTSGLAAGAAVAWRNFVAQQYRIRNKKDTAVLTRYPLAQEISLEGRGMLMASPDTPATDMLNGYWDALHLGYDYYQITLRLSKQLLAIYSPSGASNGWQPATMPWLFNGRIGVKTSRYGFSNTGNGTMVAPMAVSLDLKGKKVTFIVRTTYQPG